MPALWIWPPTVTLRPDSGSSSQWIPPEFVYNAPMPASKPGSGYAYFLTNYNVETYDSVMYRDTISSTGVMSGIRNWAYNGYVSDTSVTSANGYTVLTGANNFGHQCNFYSPDAATVGVIQGCTVYTSGSGDCVSFRAEGIDSWALYVHGAESGTSLGIAVLDSQRIELFATNSYVRHLWVEMFQSGTSMGNPVYSHRLSCVTFNTTTKAYTNRVVLWTGVSGQSWSQSTLHVLDAGEGFAYIVTSENGVNAMRSVDFNSATPVVGAAIASLPTAIVNPGHRRYITHNGSRTFLFYNPGASQFSRMTFTTTARNTPTFTNTTTTGPAGTLPGTTRTRWLTCEYDPAQTNAAYLVQTVISGVKPCYVRLAALDANNPAAGWTAWYDPGDITCDTAITVRGGEVAFSFMQGSAYPSFVAAHGFINFGLPDGGSLGYYCWHTPVDFVPGVTVNRTPSVTISRTLTKPRTVSVGTDYSSASAGVQIAAGAAGSFSWLIGSSSVSESGVTVGSGYSSVTVGGLFVTTIEANFVQHWINVGTTWMDEFMEYQNADRAAVGLPPYKTYRADGLFPTSRDVAVLHADNCARYRFYGHESNRLPAGQVTLRERLLLVPCVNGSENNWVSPTYRFSTSSSYQFPTPYEAWLAWHNSPGHYGNMVRDYGEDNDHAYSMIGISKGLDSPEMGVNFYQDFVALYLVNVFVVLETTMLEINLNQYWDNTGAIVAKMDQAWSNTAYTSVTSEQVAPYSIIVSTEFDAPYGARAATEFTIPLHSSIGTELEAPYAGTTRLFSEALAEYDLDAYSRVSRELEASWGNPMSKELATPYALLGTVAAQLEAGYGDKVVLATELDTRYDLQPLNPVSTTFTSYYDMAEQTSIHPANNVVTAAFPETGLVIKADDCVLENNDGDVGYSFSCSVASLSDFHTIVEDQAVVVDFCGETYNLFVRDRSIDRSSGASIKMRFTADQLAARMDSPYTGNISFVQEDAAMASELADQIIETGFNYEMVDWLVLAGRLQADSASPLSVVQQLTEAAGGVVDSEPSGTIRLRVPYPVAMNALDTAVVQQVYTDTSDNLSVVAATIYRDGANRFRIREGDDAFTDSLEWIEDEYQTDPNYVTGTLKAFLSPYRQNVQITHIGGAEFVTLLGEGTERREEMVEFNEGTGTTQKPIETLDYVEWTTPSLGSLVFSQYSTLLNGSTGVNKGYGLAKVVYTTRYITARAGGIPRVIPKDGVGPADAYAYFVLEDTNG